MDEIRIRLMSDLCAGNGESIGYGIDSDICKDRYGFPYIPGRRLLGCLREAAETLRGYGLKEAAEEDINSIFGDANGLEGKLRIDNAYIPGVDAMHEYIRSLKGSKRDYLIRQSTEDKIIRLFSSVRGQTKIGKDGKAEDESLRFVRVLNQYHPMTHEPMEFCAQADLSLLNENQRELVRKSCKILRHIGLNRNRGLGNVIIVLQPGSSEKKKEVEIVPDGSVMEGAEQLCISYQIEFHSPITLQEYLESGSQIKARTMIGIFSGIYLRKYRQADEVFDKLFLDGTVRWSALTPVINGIISDPVPAMFMKLKNDSGKIINSFVSDDPGWRKKKPKSLDGCYAALDKDKDKDENVYYVAKPETETTYHNRVHGLKESDDEKTGLYVQESLKQGMVYGGSVFLPRELFDTVKELLSDGQISLGRSKKVQYGTASIRKANVSAYSPKPIPIKDGEAVFAILKSDLVFQEHAGIKTDCGYVRSRIAEIAGLNNELPKGFHDICRYHVFSGYHAMWQMQKPKIQAVAGGSVYCFLGKNGECPSRLLLGEYQQEGMGIIALVSMEQMRNMGKVKEGGISARKSKTDMEAVQRLENMLLYEAALAEINEYAFRFSRDNQNKKEDVLKDIPSGRLRQMVQDAGDIASLWEMVGSMKTSDVSSESEGKRDAAVKLLGRFYGREQNQIDFDKLISDKQLLGELYRNEYVFGLIKKEWKEPILTLLHMAHYQKGGK